MILDTMYQHLKLEGVYAKKIKSDTSGSEQLAVPLADDPHGREITLYLSAAEQHFPTPENTPKNEEPFFVRLEWLVKLPFTFNALTTSEIARTIAYINRQIDMPGFEMDEVEEEVFYRHIYLGRSSDVDNDYTLSILGMIMMILDIYSSTLEESASGSRTFNELLEAAVSSLQMEE